MSRIERIELYHVEVPTPAPFYPSWIPGYPQTACRYTLARFYTDDGRLGQAAGAAAAVDAASTREPDSGVQPFSDRMPTATDNAGVKVSQVVR